MAAIEPAVRDAERLTDLPRHGMRLVVVACYVAALIVAALLVRPARGGTGSGGPAPIVWQTDVLRKHETVASSRPATGSSSVISSRSILRSTASRSRPAKLRVG